MHTNTAEKTFSNYTSTQAQAYAKGRSAYPAELYYTLMKYHGGTGGSFDGVLDIGCGPGNATRDVALSFQHATGADPGVEMVNSARTLGGKTAGSNSIRYLVSRAEDCASLPELPAGGFDMITAAAAVRTIYNDLRQQLEIINLLTRRTGSIWEAFGKWPKSS